MRTTPLRVYVETSVFGGVFDDEFRERSSVFFEHMHRRAFVMVVSDVVVRELAGAPSRVRALGEKMLPLAEVVPVTQEALALRDAYLSAGVLPPPASNDALHIALATVSGCGMIASWNFKHIVNYRRIPRFNAVNALNGYPGIMIHSPLEIVGNEDETETL